MLVFGILALGLNLALYTFPEEVFPPATWPIISGSVWLAFVASKGWRRLSVGERSLVCAGAIACLAFLEYLRRDPEFTASISAETSSHFTPVGPARQPCQTFVCSSWQQFRETASVNAWELTMKCNAGVERRVLLLWATAPVLHVHVQVERVGVAEGPGHMAVRVVM